MLFFSAQRNVLVGDHVVLTKKKMNNFSTCTLFEIFIFCPKIQLWFPEKNVDFLRWKTREIVVVLDFLAIDIFDFTRKIVNKKFGWKTRENVRVLSKLNFWTQFDF